jgi:16S rRNA (uracil1498-N3)-methyltransferase
VTLHRFCCPEAEWDGDHVRVNGAVAVQIRRVLRLGPGDQVLLFGVHEWEYTVRLDRVELDTVHGTVVSRATCHAEPRYELTLAFALLKGERTEWVIQKGTELGVTRFVLMQTERTVVAPDERRAEGRRERYARIAREATEQCGRLRPPCIEGLVPFEQMVAEDHDSALILHLWAAVPLSDLLTSKLRPATTLRDELTSGGPGARLEPARQPHISAPDTTPSRTTARGTPSVLLLVGPEGGFSDAEVALASRKGVIPASLGPRVLRAETAALAAVTLAVASLDRSPASAVAGGPSV